MTVNQDQEQGEAFAQLKLKLQTQEEQIMNNIELMLQEKTKHIVDDESPYP